MAGIFHFVSALSLPDFARAVQLAMPMGDTRHEQDELLVLDRGDLALKRRGWCLSLERDAHSARLALRQREHQASFSSPAPLTVPRHVHDIRAPRLQARLEKLLGDAPLQAVQRWQRRGLRHDCRNDDDKIECTLIAHEYGGASTHVAATPLLIELVPKRGYERETAALAARLALPWRALEHDVQDFLDELHGAQIAVAPRPHARRERAPVVVAELLLAQHLRMCACAEVGGAAPEVEALHDLRVAMRRTRSLLRAFRHCLDRELVKHFNGELRWLSRATSRLRDIDVLLEALTAPAPDYADLESDDRLRIATLLARERERNGQRLQALLASRRYRRLRHHWPAALAAQRTQPPRDAPVITVAARQAIARALARVRKDVAIVEAEYSGTALHELRKQCKRLRYLIEPFTGFYPAERIAAAQAELKRLQTMMGEICDRHAQLALFKGSLWRRAAGDTELRAALRRARVHLRARTAPSDIDAVLTALADFDASGHHADLDALFHARKS